MKVKYKYAPLGEREYTHLAQIECDIEFLEDLIENSAKKYEGDLDSLESDLKNALKSRDEFKKEHDL